MKKEKIKFYPVDDFTEKYIDFPKPAKNFIPEWYKKMPTYLDNDKSPGLSINQRYAPNTTLKACSPFLDSLSLGYIWSLSEDVEVRKTVIDQEHTFTFRWRTNNELITEHAIEQHPGFPPVDKTAPFVLKWFFPFVINTPKGYSTVFTHPMNRNDLPFRTLSGVVDTDTYNLSVQFPFNIIDQNEDIFIIEKGTPLCQFFPIKRDRWSSEHHAFDSFSMNKNTFNFKSKIIRPYKNLFWQKKYYD